MGFLFAPHYYAGYGQLKKGLVLAVISGIMPLVAIAVGIYGGLKARKELPIKEVAFNWKNVAFTSITLIVVSLISLSVISGMKGNGTGSTESSSTSESAGGNGKAMPLTEENLKKYEANVYEVIKDKYNLEDGQEINTQMMSMEDQKKIFRDTLEDMGYDYDATILEAIKMDHQNGNDTYSHKLNIPIGDKEAIQVGWITDDTAKKLALYNQFRNIKDIHTTIKLCEVVLLCQQNGNGTCYSQDLKIILDNNFGLNNDHVNLFGMHDPSEKTMDDNQKLLSCNRNDAGLTLQNVGTCIYDVGSTILINQAEYQKYQDIAKKMWWLD